MTYHVPRFQRDYSWGDEEWEDLWSDIMGTLPPDGEPAHYMGYLVLQSQDEKNFDVIDGQQRLTTLSLIILAALKNFQYLIENGNDAEANKQRMEQIRQTYIGYLDPITLVTRSKLTLNRNNDNYYQNYLVPLGHLPQRNIRASEHNLRKAFEWFDKRVADYVRKQNENSGVALARFVENISDRLFFTTISVTDDLNAFKVFETLNARGVRLSSTDLLKNYLFSVLHKHGADDREIYSLEDRWESIVSNLGPESFTGFLRSHWISRKSFVRQSDLFKTIRARISTRGDVFELLRNMEEDVETYLSLTNPDTSHWPEELKNHARLLRLFRVRQPFSLLLAARKHLDDAGFATILRACVMISFRYNVIGSLPTNEQERAYFDAARKLAAKDASTAQHVLEMLHTIYPHDDVFRAAFADKVLRTTDSRNNRIVRYILVELERQISTATYDMDSDALTVEHILPQNPAEGWEQFSDAEADALTYRIGNMTLLLKGPNKYVENAPYAEKRAVYGNSIFGMSQKLAADHDVWTPEHVATRQKALAKLATSIWRIAQLS